MKKYKAKYQYKMKIILLILVVFLVGCEQVSLCNSPEGCQPVEFDDADKVIVRGNTEWAGHDFRIASNDEDNVVFTDSGFEVTGNGMADDGLATTTLTDINLNQKIKVKVIADITGKHTSGDWSEITVYVKYSNSKYGVALFGNRDRTCPLSARLRGECTTEGVKVRDEFSFTWFSLENDGVNIIFEDSSGRRFILNENTDTEHTFPDRDVEWWLGVNSHVLGVGNTKLVIHKIEVTEG